MLNKEYKYSYLIILIVIAIAILFIILYKNTKNKQTYNDELYNIRREDQVEKEDNVILENLNKEIIDITVNEKNFTITLENNETALAILEKIPPNIKMDDLNGNEKYYYFNESLPNNPTKYEKINAGDVMLYGDNCLVIFYETFITDYKYTKVGTVNDVGSLKDKIGKGSISVSITK